MEVDILTDIISADYDDMIPQIDGIIYFINPLNIEEFELFEMFYPIVNSVKPNLPSIIMFYDKKGILPLSINDLLESLWINFPALEGFINIPPNEFHQILECLCLALILGETPLNIETAWMRFPIYIQMANSYFKQKNYYYAAQTMKKVARISEIYNNDEFFIHCEQTAFLFSKINLYLEASKILQNVDKKKSKNFKKLYQQAMIKEGNKLFNKQDYEFAALQYESAAQWASIELEDTELVNQSFKLAINSWISACKCEKGFKILDRLQHEEISIVLSEISNKIVDAIHYLISIGHLESAKNQLYYSINTYQREGLFDDLNKFANKLVEVLTKIFEKNINEMDLYSAKKVYDEIENLWETFKLKKINLDKILEKLIKLFIEELNFGMASVLINKLKSLKLKKELTEYSLKREEKAKKTKKHEIEKNIQRGIDILLHYIKEEQNIIIKMNTQILEEADELVKRNEVLNASKTIKHHSVFLNSIGKKEIANQILIKSLDILLQNLLFDDFFKYYSDLTDEIKKKYLQRIFPVFIEKLKELKEEKNYEESERIFEIANNKFRNKGLYEESKGISKLYIKAIKTEALRIVETELNISGIDKATELIKKAKNISSAYLDKDKEKFEICFDKIYKKIVEIYISLEDYSPALAIIDKIENKEFRTELHKKLSKLESTKSAIESKRVEESLKREILIERLSIIKKKGQDALQDRKNQLKERKGLKRTYFQNILSFLNNQEFDKAIEIYKESIIRLNKIKKYDLAGISLAMASLLLIKEEKLSDVIKLVNEIKKNLASSGKFFFETFPVILVEYIIDMKKLQDETKLKEAISYLENLPLFEDEIIVLYDYLDKKFKKEVKLKKPTIYIDDRAKIREDINNLAKDIKKEKQDIVKRKMMKRDYWNKPIEEMMKNNLHETSLNYLNVIPKLINKNFSKHAAIGLILGSLILIREKSIPIAKSTFEENIKKFWHNKAKTDLLPEIKLMNFLFLAFEKNFQDLIKLILNHFIKKLILFEPEIDFLSSLLGEEKIKKEEKKVPAKEKIKKLTKFKLELEQANSKLQQGIGDIQSESKDLFIKRKAMKKRFGYDEILKLLRKNDLQQASEKYLELAKQFLQRKDFKMGALLILLNGLAAIKTGESLELIKNKINEYLETLGLNKTLIKDTYYVKLLLFIIDVKLNDEKQYFLQIRRILNILPLFKEEKELI
ncbi:MAG: hypothetical protein ACFFAN_03890 [Promethearchaeota archaeon]